MQQIFNFLIRNKNNILFLALLAFSIFLTIQTHSFHKSKFISSANWVTGGIYSWNNNIQDYFYLDEYNQRLVEENKNLRNIIRQLSGKDTIPNYTDTTFTSDYTFRSADVINNNFSKRDNYITLDKGENEGIAAENGVVTSKGIIGIIDRTNTNYSRAISILNSQSKINAQLKKSNHFGSLTWNGKDPNLMQLTDVPKQAPVAKGDTIITGGKSLIFPKGLLIGTIQDFKLDNTESYFTINVKLFNDMTNIGYVYVIENKNKEEILSLEKEEEDE
ncbi:MAG: rod shape-determining protein MreC [Zunongwangia sp.]|uniref:Cell shape-determining protein MreC n=1 Tax=Zunongwangia profunda (strain DSM 18752 / CCTCC AB 206139 / SM-A87) TaxID=655815 RepID=D5BFS1_ZUNPS|nr:rod shape-determining protein MreC [Zunongwangia profunda]ADF51015.1 rod shape-determining protein MreC [Zunongwangia profunda SM-A87]MAO34956.1 rod shape-determining protein MreC [Zunongwangia sp.]MCC4227212.1 rod shape-determining protein MreC [Zunongwangia profunda]|tara:strand:- start:4191 stop:5015 length:825 start_codon:yes stop_codon:yes gene_type:complete